MVILILMTLSGVSYSCDASLWPNSLSESDGPGATVFGCGQRYDTRENIPCVAFCCMCFLCQFHFISFRRPSNNLNAETFADDSFVTPWIPIRPTFKWNIFSLLLTLSFIPPGDAFSERLDEYSWMRQFWYRNRNSGCNLKLTEVWYEFRYWIRWCQNWKTPLGQRGIWKHTVHVYSVGEPIDFWEGGDSNKVLFVLHAFNISQVDATEIWNMRVKLAQTAACCFFGSFVFFLSANCLKFLDNPQKSFRHVNSGFAFENSRMLVFSLPPSHWRNSFFASGTSRANRHLSGHNQKPGKLQNDLH